ncbi:nucleotidyl transferase AbiEii/AbiGii toxin family protein [Acidithiobacillus ferrivorans]|nr:nucleotidyl transferase AbiEii/AbiGii toxin family protein [Acidithiobacillus ferrivorans]
MTAAWESLFDKAMAAIDALPQGLPAMNWTMGGGTVLMFEYQHRLSKDVDIFITDAQYLTALSPRLNDRIENLTAQYREDSQHIKLIFPEGEVDFVAAPRLVAGSIRKSTIHGREVTLDTPAEIMAKKCFYRSDGFTARDVFDMAVFLSKSPKEIRTHLDILTARGQRIQDRLAFYAKNPVAWDREIGSVHPLPCYDHYRQKSLSRVTRFYDNPERWLKNQELKR